MNNARNLLLMSVAAGALIVGADAVFAQAPQPAPPAQQNAPAEKTAPALEPSKGAPDAGKLSGQADDKKGGKAAQDNSKGGMKPNTTASDTKAPPAPGKTTSEMKADGKAKADSKADSKTGTKADTTTKPDMKSDSRSSEKAGDIKAATETKPATTGQGAAAGSPKLSTEQRTQIRTSIKGQERVSKVNFSISVGAQVPRSGVRFYPVSRQLVELYPSWRGYDYFLVGDQIIVVNPRTLEIVAVLEA